MASDDDFLDDGPGDDPVKILRVDVGELAGSLSREPCRFHARAHVASGAEHVVEWFVKPLRGLLEGRDGSFFDVARSPTARRPDRRGDAPRDHAHEAVSLATAAREALVSRWNGTGRRPRIFGLGLACEGGHGRWFCSVVSDFGEAHFVSVRDAQDTYRTPELRRAVTTWTLAEVLRRAVHAGPSWHFEPDAFAWSPFGDRDVPTLRLERVGLNTRSPDDELLSCDSPVHLLERPDGSPVEFVPSVPAVQRARAAAEAQALAGAAGAAAAAAARESLALAAVKELCRRADGLYLRGESGESDDESDGGCRVA